MSTVRVAFYDDYVCEHASTLTPTADVPLNTCILTPGAKGLISNDAACSDGSNLHYLVYYPGTACGGTSNGFVTEGGYCASNNANTYVPGFVAYCGALSQVKITSTITYVVASTVAAATGSVSGTGSGSTTTAGSGNGSFGSGTSSSGPSSLATSQPSRSFPLAAIIVIAIVGTIIVLSLIFCLCCWRQIRNFFKGTSHQQQDLRSHVNFNGMGYQQTVGGMSTMSPIPSMAPHTFSQTSTKTPSVAHHPHQEHFAPSHVSGASYRNDPPWSAPLRPEDSASSVGMR